MSYERSRPDSGEAAAPAARNKRTIRVVYLKKRDSESINYSWLCVVASLAPAGDEPMPIEHRALSFVPSHHNHAIGERIGIRLDAQHLVGFPRG